MERKLLIDVHAHLEELEDLSNALLEAKSLGVGAIIAVGMDLESNRRTLEIAQANRGFVYPAIGYHPWKIREEEIEENLSFIRNHIEKCIALGEIGLDYKVRAKKQLQWNVLERLLDLAVAFGKPVMLHSRLSHQRTFEMVNKIGIEKAVFHWYSGPLDLLDKIIESGYFISATPALTYSPPHQQAIRKAPIERILLETDTPVAYQGKESRPKDVTMTLREVARLKGLDPIMVAKQTTLNTIQLFQTATILISLE